MPIAHHVLYCFNMFWWETLYCLPILGEYVLPFTLYMVICYISITPKLNARYLMRKSQGQDTLVLQIHLADT